MATDTSPQTLSPFLLSALVADSLSLGAHWIYNQAKIKRSFPNGIIDLTKPLASYHGDKKAGDLTHYGDQTLWLQQSIQQSNSYDPEAWKALWLEKMADYAGYIDSASSETLASKGTTLSASNDLAGASRLAPLLDLNLSLEDTIAAARSQTQLTHGDPSVIDSAEFFVRAIFAVKAGSTFLDAFLTAAQEGQYTTLDASSHIQTAIDKGAEGDHLAVASSLGLTCHFPEAFPLTLYYAIHHGENFADCMSQNALAGGDSSARAMLLTLLFTAKDHPADIAEILRLVEDLTLAAPISKKQEFTPGSHRLSIDSRHGILSGVIEIPENEIKACAIFAHCFTCGKDYLPEKKITQALAKNGIATVRVDFSGLGHSSGAFEDSSFLTNIEDIYTVADWLRENYLAPNLLIGHSLGGTAVLAAAAQIPEIKAVATVGAPADPAHILHMFSESVEEIQQNGKAVVSLAGRNFTISQKFIDDVKGYDYIANLKSLKGQKLIMHSPIDQTVELKNAGEIYTHLQHPKSFIALDGADHLLTADSDVDFVAQMTATWAKKVIS